MNRNRMEDQIPKDDPYPVPTDDPTFTQDPKAAERVAETATGNPVPNAEQAEQEARAAAQAEEDALRDLLNARNESVGGEKAPN